MNRIIHKIDQVLKARVGILFALIFVASITQVFFRYVLNSPFSWGEELVRFVNIWCIFLAAGYGIARGAHFGLDFFIGKLPRALQEVGRILCHLLVFFLSVVLVASGLQLVTKTLGTVSQMLQIPFGLVYLAIPVGFAMIGIFSAIEIVKLLRNLVSRRATIEKVQ